MSATGHVEVVELKGGNRQRYVHPTRNPNANRKLMAEIRQVGLEQPTSASVSATYSRTLARSSAPVNAWADPSKAPNADRMLVNKLRQVEREQSNSASIWASDGSAWADPSKDLPEPLVQRIDAEKAPVNNEFGKVMYEYEDDPIPQYAAGLAYYVVDASCEPPPLCIEPPVNVVAGCTYYSSPPHGDCVVTPHSLQEHVGLSQLPSAFVPSVETIRVADAGPSAPIGFPTGHVFASSPSTQNGKMGNKAMFGFGEMGETTTSRSLNDWSTRKERRQPVSRPVEFPDFNTVPEIKKNFYCENKSVTNMSDEDVEKLRQLNNETSISRMLPEGVDPATAVTDVRPVWEFKHCWREYPELMQAFEKNGFKTPTAIQCQMWPILLSGHDTIGIAQTGSGKTLAFLLPAFVHIEGQSIPRAERRGPTVLVLTPTHELAQQIELEVRKYPFRGIHSVCVHGGTPVDDEARRFIDAPLGSVDIVIATPGRFTDLVNRGAIMMHNVSYLVLDEADRMLDQGFLPQINQIRRYINPKRQTVMTSATWPAAVRDLGRTVTVDPFMVLVGTLNLSACQEVTQIVYVAQDAQHKETIFDDIVSKLYENEKVIIFVNSRNAADHLVVKLGLKCNIRAEALHAGRDATSRHDALTAFRNGDVTVLVATDVASRGLDVPDVSIVINYDMPRELEEYVHRVGRTGRAGRAGTSITMFEYRDRFKASELIDVLKRSNASVPPKLIEWATKATWQQNQRNARTGDVSSAVAGGHEAVAVPSRQGEYRALFFAIELSDVLDSKNFYNKPSIRFE